MRKYVAKCNKIVTCIYGMRQLVEGVEVPECFGLLFPQYVKMIEIPDEDTINIIKDTINQESKRKGN